MAVAALLSIQTAAAQQAGGAPLPPVGPWGVDYADNSCIVSHRFGTGASAVDVAFQLLPRSNSTTVAITVGRGAPAHGRATITLEPDGRQFGSDFGTVPLPDGRRLLFLRVFGGDLAVMIQSSRIHVVAGKVLDVTVAPNGMPGAFHAADACKDDLLKAWHIDPAPLATAITPAKPQGAPGTWVTNNDYPQAAVRDRVSGATVFRLTIDPTGTVSACNIVISSKSDLLDRTTCTLMLKRARYSPALDANGKPVADIVVERFIWMLWGS
jgi:TonB family protein